MPNIKPAEVEIDLGGEPVTLSCSLDAAMAINTYFSGFAIAHQRVQNMDLEAMAVVIRHGAGMDAKTAKNLPGKVFAAGAINYIAPLARYIVLLLNGGNEPKAEPDAGEL